MTIQSPERLAGAAARLELGAIELEAQLLQPVGHALDAQRPVGLPALERSVQLRGDVIDAVAEHVHVGLRAALDGRHLDRRHHIDAVLASDGQCLLHPVHRVVVGQREQPDARGCGGGDDCGGLQGAVGAGRMCL